MIFKWASVSLLVLLFLFTIVVWFNWDRPNIGFEVSGKDTVVHLETLADYPTHIDRIVIAKEDHPADCVFEAISEDHANIHRFKVHAGSNAVSAIRAFGGTYEVLFPHATSFVLRQNQPYLVTVREGGKCRSAHFTIQ